MVLGALKSLRRLFDRKISDKTTRGYNPDEVKSWLSNVQKIDSLKYYYYAPGSKFPSESKSLKNQTTEEGLSLLGIHFAETPDVFVEIQHKVFKSGRHEIIFRGISLKGEITKIAVLDFMTPKS